jgi:hypothetical protein
LAWIEQQRQIMIDSRAQTLEEAGFMKNGCGHDEDVFFHGEGLFESFFAINASAA